MGHGIFEHFRDIYSQNMQRKTIASAHAGKHKALN